jgi:hypothetical protein
LRIERSTTGKLVPAASASPLRTEKPRQQVCCEAHAQPRAGLLTPHAQRAASVQSLERKWTPPWVRTATLLQRGSNAVSPPDRSRRLPRQRRVSSIVNIKSQVGNRTTAATPAAAPRRNMRPGDDKREAKPPSRPAVDAPTSRRAARSRASATVRQKPSSQPAWRPSHQTAPEQVTACVSSRLLLMRQSSEEAGKATALSLRALQDDNSDPGVPSCDGAACDCCWGWQTRHEEEQ